MATSKTAEQEGENIAKVEHNEKRIWGIEETISKYY